MPIIYFEANRGFHDYHKVLFSIQTRFDVANILPLEISRNNLEAARAVLKNSHYENFFSISLFFSFSISSEFN